MVIKQPEPVRPYTGTTSYKAYKEYFERICVCNEWNSQTECARHLLVAMDGAASEAVRGLKAEKESDLALIWEALSRRFGFVDEPERAMRRFDVRKQLEGETLAMFEQRYACCTRRRGRRRTSSHPRPTRYYAGSSSTVSSLSLIHI